MPKETFFNLNEDKRRQIEAVLKQEFSKYPLHDATVKHIVEELNISRGSFYQYFESLEESYFYILYKDTAEMHLLFLQHLNQNSSNLIQALLEYGQSIAKELYREECYAIYKNKFLYWNINLEKSWREYLLKNDCDCKKTYPNLSNEKMYFISALVHSLMQRLFLEEWSKEEFLKNYVQYIDWMNGGICK